MALDVQQKLTQPARLLLQLTAAAARKTLAAGADLPAHATILAGCDPNRGRLPDQPRALPEDGQDVGLPWPVYAITYNRSWGELSDFLRQQVRPIARRARTRAIVFVEPARAWATGAVAFYVEDASAGWQFHLTYLVDEGGVRHLEPLQEMGDGAQLQILDRVAREARSPRSN